VEWLHECCAGVAVGDGEQGPLVGDVGEVVGAAAAVDAQSQADAEGGYPVARSVDR